MNSHSSLHDLSAAAGQCVKCGLCLPQCPSWSHSQRESDSPRGRVELIAALAGGALQPDTTVRARLDACLMCRACEAVCPAQVPFAHLMDQARKRWPVRRLWQDFLFRSPVRKMLLRTTLWLASVSGVLSRWQKWKPHHVVAVLPSRVQWRRRALSTQEGVDEIGLFTGCVTDVVDRATLNDAAALLEHTGARVRWIDGGGCCGALARHQGDDTRSDVQVRANLGCSRAQSCNVLTSVATGCALEFRDYPQHCDDPKATTWASRHREVLQYLSAMQGRLQFRPSASKVWLHQPCTARQIPGHSEATRELLARIPQLRLFEAEGSLCCGAGGMTTFQAPDQARDLGERVVAEFRDSGADTLLTANIGCAMHLRQVLRESSHEARVCHPVNLLQEQLQRTY